MLITKKVTVEGRTYPVTLSDDKEALQAAYAAGGAIIGIWSPSSKESFKNCLYLVEDPRGADRKLLEKAVRRRFGLPLIIGVTERLIIREFRKEDPLEEEEVPEFDNRVFCERSLRDAYIENQYVFCECGLWALVERKSGLLIGKAGITDGELGYHIYKPFRGLGFAEEACRRIIGYGTRELLLDRLKLSVSGDNRPSIRLAEKLGFILQREEGGTRYYEKTLI